MTSDSFLNVSREMLCQILDRDTLDISELSLFGAVHRWVRKRIQKQGLECNGETKRAILGEEVIRLIRFPLLTEGKFADVVLPLEILEKSELTELVQRYNSISPATNMFSNNKRYAKSQFISSSRFRLCPSSKVWEYDREKADAVAFTTNKTCYLVGVQMFGNEGSKYNGNLTIYKNGETISHKTVDDDGKGLVSRRFSVYLNKSVKVVPGVLYTNLHYVDHPLTMEQKANPPFLMEMA